ncbi:MAG: thioredoxin domain-containing protein [Patescibacteria group bacterium]|mgnify:FL=1
MTKNILIISITVAAGLIALLIWGGAKNVEKINPAMDSFAQCLASKNITMYGAKWCSYCQKQKADFGASFKYVPYVECLENTKQCLDLGIQGYPTWIFPNGEKLVGYQGLEKLAEASGCKL